VDDLDVGSDRCGLVVNGSVDLKDLLKPAETQICGDQES
jgi:hypothetical protein